MSSAKLSVTNVATEPEEEGDDVIVNSIPVEVSRSGIEPLCDQFYGGGSLYSNSDSEPEFIELFDPRDDGIPESWKQRLRTLGGLHIWDWDEDMDEDMELELGIGSGSGDTDSRGVVVPREIDVEVGTGIDLNGDETMVVDEEFESAFYNVTNPIDLVEEPIQANPPRDNDWQSLLDDDIRFFEDMDLVYEDGDIDEMDEAVLARTFDSQEGVMGNPPASKRVVDNLPAVVITSEELRNGDIVCAICKDEIAVAKRLPCKHYYHEECIVPWLGIRNTCPVCRYELPTDDLEYETNKRLQRRG